MDTTQGQVSVKGHFPAAKHCKMTLVLSQSTEVTQTLPVKSTNWHISREQFCNRSVWVLPFTSRTPLAGFPGMCHTSNVPPTPEREILSFFCKAHALAGATGPWSQGTNHFPFLCISKFRLAQTTGLVQLTSFWDNPSLLDEVTQVLQRKVRTRTQGHTILDTGMLGVGEKAGYRVFVGGIKKPPY